MSGMPKKIEGETKTISVVVPKRVFDYFKEKQIMPSVFIREMLEKEMVEAMRSIPGGSHPARVKSLDAAMQIVEECLSDGKKWHYFALRDKIQVSLDVHKTTANDYFEQIKIKGTFKNDGYSLWKEVV